MMGTAEFTNEEVGVYIRLLCHQWDRGHVPADPERLRRIAAMSRDEFDSAWEQIREKFQPAGSKKLQNPVLEEVRKDVLKRAEKKSERGREGAAARWGPHVDSRKAELAAMVRKDVKDKVKQSQMLNKIAGAKTIADLENITKEISEFFDGPEEQG